MIVPSRMVIRVRIKGRVVVFVFDLGLYTAVGELPKGGTSRDHGHVRGSGSRQVR
jgi:hypothetical protein